MYEVLSNCSTAQAQYAGVKSAVLSSQTALAQVNSIEATDNETREVETIVQNIKAMFEKFESKLRKFESSLGNVKAVNRWREVLREIQWQRYSREDVKWLQDELQHHASALQAVLTSIQM